MGKTIKDSLSILDETIKSEDFLKNRGLGNEVGYYIFDYDPKDELLVREYVRAHSVLNKMHLVYTKRPVIMMYPCIQENTINCG